MIKVIFVTVLGLVLSSGAAYARKGNGTFVLGLEEAIAVVLCLFVHLFPHRVMIEYAPQNTHKLLSCRTRRRCLTPTTRTARCTMHLLSSGMHRCAEAYCTSIRRATCCMMHTRAVCCKPRKAERGCERVQRPFKASAYR